MNKKIAYISGTRADFGLMTPVLAAIKKSKKLDLKLYVTGIHLMPEFGNTIKEIKKQFPEIIEVKAVFESDEKQAMAEFASILISKLVSLFEKDRPDFVLTLGDRPEMISVALVCLYLGIPTGQIHGGDKSATVDEIARHAITKLSHLHFPATREAAERIKKMGEESWRIKVVGAPALDVIMNEQLPTREQLFKNLGLDLKKKVILVTQHPVSEEYEKSGSQMAEIISAIKTFELPVVIIYPHADAGGRRIISEINKENKNPNFHIFPSLPHKDFLALEREAAVWVGNSSAAMIESASFGVPIVNIGGRQSDRQRGLNVLNVGYDRNKIKRAMKKSLFDTAYLKTLKKIKNPWGDGKTGQRVMKTLENIKIDSKLLNKQITY
ncbi:MAG: UDP-N-acetyl-D-glucosamine 2-epimerase, UDP-hydrolysing [Candidatus Yanofskybacteria bacterium RIFCSPLOWO2_02_FULL_43_10]|uniref:UDP-N-acetyl-D-glucosamine 2-epimerase, UDP-hydrolysing n=1 Tax=Candidatus Yanofskybacteria bacterium RIFCSPLOWO2_12_FULL_43_11b TaxID=1802710 RepID=A0A1F8H9F8_9BACT|nr:MAG: UDP-N-acetyl-D-glucosamine 2-epimerase, UDP-hydrolysing [Candidatus Yanofskybacteria bacterium RIFCSPHIGHO2_01_FULL_43_32]OGN11033.1 MAG: UDP-N-acetyl-D-glucosamine 2-epimerase, UDP-hydrolysing [Candidatus Yanofskybacteria bacterium RIFCSPHIGHO2_02_FULL_43_12]OGN18178.1 MAG: UDP-N-acetyl-D-glucosamine 2-epimerase, UDP-hydrolysing [Candidatus Yanofskybacteria bacterium RIFCSPHIGHO2_12_FULL_43_11]OGN24231.1 MAG: UDP-N-acetyl-D-glucosamine 2-epimerase, UDP-hydrolysing [Candidatus Yanofskyba